MGAEQSRAHRGSLDSLQSMGFTEEQAIVALQAANGDLQRASLSSGTPEERVQRCAQMLAGHAEAVDVLITSLSRALENPKDEKYRRVNPSNPTFARTVGATPGGIELLWAVGYENVHGHLVLQKRDAALLWLGKSALEAVRASSTYAASKEAAQLDAALSLSGAAYEEEDEKRRAAWLKRVPEEPTEGAAGNSLICVHVGDAQVWRRFESCNTLEDLGCFVRSLKGAPVHGLTLTNVTMSPPTPLSLETQLGLTLQKLDLWPTGHVRASGP